MKRIIYIVLAVAAIAGLIAITGGDDKESAVLTEQKPNTAEQQTEEQKKAEEAAKLTAQNFTYVAQRGDSYSLMARKAVQAYLAESKQTLSNAQIIFAETNLTKLANSPRLDVSQNVTLAKNTVKEWADKAKALTQEQQARWDVYAKRANFDTSAVGVTSR